MLDSVKSWQLHIDDHLAWQYSAAKGLMGACPHMRMLHLDRVPGRPVLHA